MNFVPIGWVCSKLFVDSIILMYSDKTLVKGKCLTENDHTHKINFLGKMEKAYSRDWVQSLFFKLSQRTELPISHFTISCCVNSFKFAKIVGECLRRKLLNFSSHFNLITKYSCCIVFNQNTFLMFNIGWHFVFK